MPTHPQYPSIDHEGRWTWATRISAFLFVILLPALAVVAAIALLCLRMVTWTDLGIFAGMYALTTVGIGVGYHRLFTHRAFETPKPIRYTLSLMGALAAQAGPIVWAAEHRQHHAASDQAGDPHSPHVGRKPGFLGVIKALWHAHYGHVFRQVANVEPERYVPDLIREPFLRGLEKWSVAVVVAGFLISGALGWAISGSYVGGLTGMLWGGFVRLFLITHATGAVNSVCHFFGSRPFETGDRSGNVWWLTPVTFGESWHNGHHAFPTSARHGLRWWEVDPSWLVIWALEKVGLASNVVRIAPARQEAKKANDSTLCLATEEKK